MNFKSTKRRIRGKPSQNNELQYRYDSKLPITAAKKADLLSLCTSGIIPEAHHMYYKNLKTDNQARDKLPMPDAEESEYETDEN